MTDPIFDLVKELTYINYASNRESSPQIPAADWKVIFGNDVGWMEERYQAEKEQEAA